VFYEWQRRFFENEVKAFESDEKQESKQLREKVGALEAKLKRKDSAMSELVEELIIGYESVQVRIEYFHPALGFTKMRPLGGAR
jgi:hypothetical protein